MDWQKLAILGSTYARALGNAAGRAGRDVGAMQPALSSIAQQPLAKLRPGMSSFVREPGALTPTAPQQNMQKMLAKVPWAGAEHGGSPHAESTLNTMLRRRGLDQNTPAGQPNVNQRIQQSFGAPRAAPTEKPTQVGYASGDPEAPAGPRSRRNVGVGHQDFGGNIFDLWEGGRVPGKIGLPGVTQNAPAPDVTRVLRKTGSALSTAAGIGIPLAVGSSMLASKPGIQSNVKNLFSGKGSTEEQDKANVLPEPALHQADAIHQALLAHGLDPRSMRIGIDAPPGSGKTTLARALAHRTGMTHYGLDWEPGNAWKSTIGLGRNVEKMPHAPRAGEIMEHYLLNRTHDPELFDAQIHLKRDPDVIRKQLIHRGNASYISDTMDLDKSLGVADLGFDTLGGDTIDLGDGTLMKLRPREGWGNVLDQRLMQSGIDPTGLSRHEKLLSLHGGKRTTGAGWTPYMKNPFSTGQTLALGASVPLGIMAAKALARHPRLR